MRTIIAFCVASLVGCFTAVSWAQSDPAEEARIHFKQGVEFYKDGEFEQAATEFHRAYELRPNYKILFNLAQTENELKNYAKALEAYIRYQVEGGDEIPEKRQKQVQSEIDRLNNLVGVVEVLCPVKDAEVTVDGEYKGDTPLPYTLIVDVGKHEILVKKGMKELHRRVFRIAGGQRITISVGGKQSAQAAAAAASAEQRRRDLEARRKWEAQRLAYERDKERQRVEQARQAQAQRQQGSQPTLPPAEDDEPKRVWTWVAIGVGGAAAVGTAVAGGVALSRGNDLRDDCPNDVCPTSLEDEGEAVRKLNITTNVLMGVAIAGVATGVVLYFVEPGLHEEQAVAVVPYGTSDGAGLAVGGRF